MARWSSRPSHRLRLRTGVAAFACTVLVTASILGPSMEPSRAAMDRPDGDVEVLRDVPYYTGPGASDTKHVLDLYLPASGIGYPTALFLHGGGWRSGDKQEVPGELYDNIGYGLASRGIAVAIANYRLTDGSAQSVSHPGHIQDVARAFSFTRAYMVTGGGDPNSIYVLGHEAGAHLAALLATNERFLALHGLAAADVRGVVGLSGMYHVDALGGDDEDVFGAEPGSRRDASPIDNVETARAPFELMVAEADRAGLDQEAERFAQALLAVGVPAEVHEIAGRDHSSIVSAVGESGDMTTGLIVDFIYGGRYRTATPTVTSSPTLTPRPTATPTPTPTPVQVPPPEQPASGPGGSASPFAGARMTRHSGGGAGFWLVEPVEPMPRQAAVVVFVGHSEAGGPEVYRSWLEHIARRGYVVIWPDRPEDRREAEASHAAAAESVAAALAKLEARTGFVPDREHVGYAGHGDGAATVASLAADWFALRIPLPRALLLAMPRDAPTLLVGDLGRVPSDTRVLFVAAEEDDAYDSASEVLLWDGLRHVPGAWRERLMLRSDRYGLPPLVADKEMALTDGPPGTTDALDYFGTWKWLDALLSCAFERLDCEYAFGETPEQRFMGEWQDGRAVREAVVSRDVPRPTGGSVFLPAITTY